MKGDETMDKFVMEGQPRAASEQGTRAVRRLRSTGQMPVNIYGGGKPNQTYSVKATDFYGALEQSHRLFEINCDGKSEMGIVKEVQYDTFGDHAIHADLARVSMDDVVDGTMHIKPFGVPKGLSTGGTLDVAYHHIPVRGKVSAMVDSVVVNIEHLASDESIRAQDIEIPEGVETSLPGGTPIIIVHGRRGG
ncbi:MAG: 50S ribosomal protein L25 [Planctomycetes bacterium]|jgi:large subunit ribosomal protein L25|nr:50S ribosomal protein L25 [Planctomycetota bacterium]MBT6540079.1 50S ribosomal protein L25 [Planctomycetota bacterium]MBT6968135.1 50S ribosomal protein L25 [Planctomycetota bacterium]